MQLSGLMQFLDDRDAVFGGHFQLIQRGHQILKLGPAGVGRVDRDDLPGRHQRIPIGGFAFRADRRDRQSLLADDRRTDLHITGDDHRVRFVVHDDPGFGVQQSLGNREALDTADESIRPFALHRGDVDLHRLGIERNGKHVTTIGFRIVDHLRDRAGSGPTGVGIFQKQLEFPVEDVVHLQGPLHRAAAFDHATGGAGGVVHHDQALRHRP